MIRKYASHAITDISAGASMRRVAHRATFAVERRPTYIYVTSRLISSRTNMNFDRFEPEEIVAGFKTFAGKPVFVNHNNDFLEDARGFVIAQELHVDTLPSGEPDTWVEGLHEIDGKAFPKLGQKLLDREITTTSMGVDLQVSVCTACGNAASNVTEYCEHIPNMKGQRIAFVKQGGGKFEVLVAESCKGLTFFENSLLVEPPADPTAQILSVDSSFHDI